MTTNAENQSSSDVVGILFAHDRLEGCRTSQTLLGRVRRQYASVPIQDGDLESSFTALMDDLGADKQALPVAVAIPTNECYFATRPLAVGGVNASPRTLLRESLRSNSVRLDQMAIDVIQWQPDRRMVVGICAAPEARIEAIRTAINGTQHSLQRLAPAASTLIGMAPTYEGRERRNALTTRVFLGKESLLAVMSRGNKPIHWQRLPLPAGDEATGIVSAIRSLETAASACGLDRTPDQVVIHGRPELQSLLDMQWLESHLSTHFRWVENPAMTGHDVTTALADHLIEGSDEGFDLVRMHRDPLKLHRVFPYRELVAYFVAACLLAGVLWSRWDSIEGKRMTLVASAPPMVGDGTNPQPEKERLASQAKSISQFLDKRVHWSQVLNEVTETLPEGMQLLDIRGMAPMPRKVRKRIKALPATLTLRARCVLSEDGSMPVALDNLAQTYAANDAISTHFETIELSDLHRTRDQETGVAGAEFSLIFTAKTKRGR